ncbi:MAG: helix-turn-helix domain-containing protein [Deltaproteobacteria bacterium]|nr:helix-turn-helix domain-containing protein [Deltaproteobacteria bacterium]
MKTSGTKKNYRVDEVATILNCSTRTIYRLLADGEILAFYVRKSLRVPAEGVELYMKQQIVRFQEENDIDGEFSVTGSPSSPLGD